MQQGIADGTRIEVFLMPAGVRHSYEEEMHANVAVVKMLSTS